MLPRINMAINLSRHLRAPKVIQNALLALRKTIQDGLDVRRNRAVHGVTFIALDSNTLEIEVHRGRGNRERTPSPDSEMTALADEIFAASLAFQKSLVEVGWVDPTAVAAIIERYTRNAADDAVSDSGS